MLTRRLVGLEGLRALREPWLSLHAGAGLFARYEWHLASALHLLGDAPSIAYVQVLDGERTVAIVPAIAGIESVPLFGRLRVLSLGLHAHQSLADFPLAADVRVEEVAAALRAALATWPERWDVLYWNRVLASSHAMRLARAFDAFAAYIAQDGLCNTIDTRQPFPELSAHLSKNLRASLRKSQKRLEESGGAQITIDAAAYDAFLAIEASGWKGETGIGSAIRLDPAARGFYAELLALRGIDFAPEVTLLLRGDKPIAAQFSVCVNRCKHVLKIGYDEAESRFSPGQVLMAGVLEAASGGTIERVSLVTDMPWHHTWRPVAEPRYHVRVFRGRGRAALFRVLRRFFSVARTAEFGGVHTRDPARG